MSLTAPHISALELEKSCMTLWEEFLRGLFDGASHQVGVNHATLNPAVTFPKCELGFGQAALPQPLGSGALESPRSIAVAWVTPGTPSLCDEWIDGTSKRQKVAYARGQFHFFVRSNVKEAGAGDSQYNARQIADLLHGLLLNSMATKPLAEKGIHSLKCSTPTLVAKGTAHADGAQDHAMRLLVVTATLRYPILSQSLSTQ